ncbi:Structural maintenance of chromosomes protein 4 [Intoshia linei]|uniref:Structural maintenance of chromosomes protein 4 n=1 Tax=Intoshia linei TaxID=1819745 RepID=A0A177B7L0_9BILA|nr:Structural maintenance of chromosomes protein 4 [Intoshia linei]
MLRADQKITRLKVSEKDRDALEYERNLALDYVTKQNKQIEKTNLLYQCQIYDINDKIKNELTLLDELDAKKKAITTEFKQCKNFVSENSTVEMDLIEKVKMSSKELNTINNAFSKYEVDDVTMRRKQKTISKKISKIQEKVDEDVEKIDKLSEIPTIKENEMKFVSTQRKSLVQKMDKLTNEHKELMERVSRETKPLREKKSKFEKVLITKKSELNKVDSKIVVKESQLITLKSDENNIMSEIEKTGQGLKKYQENLSGIESELKVKKNCLKSLSNKLVEGKSNLDDYNRQVKPIECDIEKLRHTRNESKHQMQTSGSRNVVLNAIMEQSKKGNLKGVLGRLGDLGTVHSKYDVAVSTSCGILDYIVVETINDAQACVEFLKRYNIGRGSFLALDKLHKWERHTTCSNSQRYKRLFDLINFSSDSVKNAFYFGLRETIVTDTLSEASKIAYSGSQRCRVVTIAGQLIDQTGTMSGGGNPLRGRICISNEPKTRQNSSKPHSEEDIKNFEDKIQNLKLQLDNLYSKIKHCTVSVESIQKEIIECRHNIERNESQEKYLDEQIKFLKTSLSDKKRKVSNTLTDSEKLKIDRLEKDIKTLNETRKNIANENDSLEKEIDAISNECKKMAGPKLVELEKSMDDTNDKIGQIDSHIAKIDAEKISTIEQLERLNERITKDKTELKQFKDEENEYIRILDKNEKEVVCLIEKKNELDTFVNNLKSQIKEISKSIKENEDRQRQLKNDFVTIKHELNEVNHKVEDAKKNIRYLKSSRNRLEFYKINPTDKTIDLIVYTQEEIFQHNIQDLKLELVVIEQDLLKITPNMGAIEEYREKSIKHRLRARQLAKITNIRDEHHLKAQEFKKQRFSHFMKGFSIIGNRLKQMYQMLTLGGDAELELVDALQPFSEGVVFSVRPTHKSWKNISNLSGGEKTLSSLALIFSLHDYRPTPFYIMDEIDAALDFRNVSIVANYIKNRKSQAQFIIISLRSNMFELADRLIGIYKTHSITQTVAIDCDLFQKPIEIEKLNTHEPQTEKKVSQDSPETCEIIPSLS